MKMRKNILNVAALFAAAFSAMAGDVVHFQIEKVQNFLQSNATTTQPSPATPFQMSVSVQPDFSAEVSEAYFQYPPANQPQILSKDDLGNYSFSQPFSSQSQLNSKFPSGTYLFTFDTGDLTQTPWQISVDGAFPSAVPTISNYSAAQLINPDSSFTIRWQSFSGAAADDFIRLSIQDSFGNVLFSPSMNGDSEELPANTTSYTIPAFMLEASTSYTLLLSFVNPGATINDPPGGAAMRNSTSVGIRTSGGGSGDDTPPFVIFVSPTYNSTGVAVNSPVSFTFTEAMQPGHSIAWSANVNPANFIYSWNAGGNVLTAVYTPGFPQNSLITWKLNPDAANAEFKDLAGNPVPVGGFIQGSFTTSSGGSGTNNPCTTNGTDRANGYFMFKSMNYLQTSAAAPVESPVDPASFFANLSWQTGSVSSASVRLPNGSGKQMTSLFGVSFFLGQEFGSKAAMDAAYPNGQYTINITNSSSQSFLGSLNLTAPEPPVPHVANYPETQNFDFTKKLTLRWDPYSNAVISNDSISLTISDQSGNVVFSAPDPCIPRELKVTDTTIDIPAGTFSSGKIYHASLIFFKSSGRSTAIPQVPGFAAFSFATEFDIRASGGSTGGTNGASAVFTAYSKQPNGLVKMDVTVTANASYTVQHTADFLTWQNLFNTNSPTGFFSFSDPISRMEPKRFFRVKSN